MTTADTTLLLTNRLVSRSVEPLKAKEYWAVVRSVPIAELESISDADLAARLEDRQLAGRIRRLLDAATGFAIAREELESQGIRLLAAGAEGYPDRLIGRLGDAAPPVLYVAGPGSWLDGDLIGVAGSTQVDEAGSDVAGGISAVATRFGAGIVSGGAAGIETVAMEAAARAEIPSVVVVAEGLGRAGRRKALRAAVSAERLLLVSPYAPSAGASSATALGRNKIIYGLARSTLVVASDHGTGDVWAGASEAMQRGFGPVAVWSGPGGGSGNGALVANGASPVSDLEKWVPVDP